MPYVLGLFPCIVQGKSQQEIGGALRKEMKSLRQKLQERYPAGGMKLSAGICFLSGKSSFETILRAQILQENMQKEHNITSGVVYIEKCVRHVTNRC